MARSIYLILTINMEVDHNSVNLMIYMSLEMSDLYKLLLHIKIILFLFSMNNNMFLQLIDLFELFFFFFFYLFWLSAHQVDFIIHFEPSQS